MITNRNLAQTTSVNICHRSEPGRFSFLPVDTCAVTSDNSLSDGAMKGHDCASTEVNLRKIFKIALYLMRLIVVQSAASNDCLTMNN